MRKALMLASFILIAACMFALKPAVASPATALMLSEVTPDIPDVGEKFNVTLSVIDVTDLYTWVATIEWDPAILNHTGPTGEPPSPPYRIWWNPVWTGNKLVASISNTGGEIVELMGQLLGAVPGLNGTMELCTIEFVSTSLGTTGLNITFSDLLDSTIQQNSISHEVINSSVTVVPEFLALLLMPIFLIATIIAAFLGKTVWSTRRRGRVDAK